MSTDYQTAREALGARLRELRIEAALEGKNLAGKLGCQPSKVSRLQNGKQTERGLGDIGLVAVVDVLSEGEELWRLAHSLGGRNNDADRARWILTQANRARVVAAYTDLPRTTWTAYIRRRIDLDALFANHAILLTGRISPPMSSSDA